MTPSKDGGPLPREIKKEILKSPPKARLSLADILANPVKFESNDSVFQLINHLFNKKRAFEHDEALRDAKWTDFTIKIPPTSENEFISLSDRAMEAQKFLVHLERELLR